MTIFRTCAVILALVFARCSTQFIIRTATQSDFEVRRVPERGRSILQFSASELSTGFPTGAPPWFMPAIWGALEFGHLPFVGERNIQGQTYYEEPPPSEYDGTSMHAPDRALQIVNQLHNTDHAFAIAYRDTDEPYLDGSYEYTPIGYDELCAKIIDDRVRYWFARRRSDDEPFQGMEEEPEYERSTPSSHAVAAAPSLQMCIECRVRVVIYGEPYCVRCFVDHVRRPLLTRMSSSGAGPSGAGLPVVVLDDDDDDDDEGVVTTSSCHNATISPDQPAMAMAAPSSSSRTSSPVTFVVNQPVDDDEPLPPSPNYSPIPSEDDNLNSAEFGTPPASP